MEIRYFEDTDTLYVAFNRREVAETKDLTEDLILDVDDTPPRCELQNDAPKAQTKT